MSTETIAVIAGVILVVTAVLGKMPFAFSAEGKLQANMDKSQADKILNLAWWGRFISGVLGLSLVLPYVLAAWGATGYGHLFSPSVNTEVNWLILYFGPDSTDLKNSNGRDVIVKEQNKELVGRNKEPNRTREWIVQTSFRRQFSRIPNIVPTISGLPAAISGHRFSVKAEALDNQNYKVTIDVWPDKPDEPRDPFDEKLMAKLMGQVSNIQFEVGVIATE